MKVLIALLWFLAMTVGAVYAQELEVQRLDVTDFGIYALDREISGRDQQGISLGTATNIQHTSTQRTVPAQLGVTFGFRYRIVGKPEGAAIPVKKVIIYPAPGLQTPSPSSRVRKAVFEHEASIGRRIQSCTRSKTNSSLFPERGCWRCGSATGSSRASHSDWTSRRRNPRERWLTEGGPNPENSTR
jgi:hypothetical protein